jgi:hypothetical protein
MMAVYVSMSGIVNRLTVNHGYRFAGLRKRLSIIKLQGEMDRRITVNMGRKR